MISPNATRAEIIKWLADTISAETEKPFDRIDYDFVDECGKLLDELMGRSAAMSENEIEEKLKILIPAKSSPVRKRVANGRLWKIAIIAAVVLCMSITVLAVPQLRTMLLNALQLDIGETVGDGGVTYIYNGKGTTYENLDTLIATENLDMLVPTPLPKGIYITSIWATEDSVLTVISFNDPTINLRVLHKTNAITENLINEAEKVSINGFDAYITKKDHSLDTVYTAHLFAKKDTYILMCSDRQQLLSIIEAFTNGGTT